MFEVFRGKSRSPHKKDLSFCDKIKTELLFLASYLGRGSYDDIESSICLALEGIVRDERLAQLPMQQVAGIKTLVAKLEEIVQSSDKNSRLEREREDLLWRVQKILSFLR